jgi:shikimate dehydrogenase
VLKKVKNLISNNIEIENSIKKYALIIGDKPSMGARSPLLWNAAFKKHKISCKMYPADVKKNYFKKLIKELYKDKKFLAAAITNPYKEIIYQMLKKQSSSLAKEIQSGNCLYRKKNKFFLTNTDAEASFFSLKKKFKLKKKNIILIMGFGGVGKAVATSFNHYLGKNSQIYIATRKKMLRKKNYLNFISWKEINNVIKKVTICINCTSIGFRQKNRSPLTIEQINKFKEDSILYDVIYDPKKTYFLKLGEKKKLNIINGVNMNFMQAVLGFNIANNLKTKSITAKAMKQVVC